MNKKIEKDWRKEKWGGGGKEFCLRGRKKRKKENEIKNEKEMEAINKWYEWMKKGLVDF